MEGNYINPINFFWIGAEVSPVEILSFKSCLKNNMTPILWSYEEIQNLPYGVISRDANEILKIEKMQYLLEIIKLPLPNVSDFFRYELLYKKGGIYADTDIIFIRNLYKLESEEYFCSTFEYNYGQCANGCLMRIKKDSDIAKFLIEEAYARLNLYIHKSQDIDYCEFGPFVVQECARLFPIEILSYDIINPISWRWATKLIAYKNFDIKFHIKQLIRFCLPILFESRGYFLSKNTVAIHLCNEVWRKNGIDKYTSQHKLSLFEKLKDKMQ